MRQIANKRSIRSRLLAARAALPAETLHESSAAVWRHLAELLVDTPLARDSGAGHTIAAYVPFGHEPGGDLPERLAGLLPEATLLLPVVLPDRDLDWAAYLDPIFLPTSPEPPGQVAAAGLPLMNSALREPTGPRLGPAAIERAEVIIVPALAVDRHGNRLGRGGGSYDRALARVGPATLTVALLHAGELLDEVPADPHDQPIQVVITSLGRHRCTNAR